MHEGMTHDEKAQKLLQVAREYEGAASDYKFYVDQRKIAQTSADAASQNLKLTEANLARAAQRVVTGKAKLDAIIWRAV